MKKAALIGLLIISLPATATEKNQISEAIEKGMRQSIMGKLLKNKAGINIVDTSKRFNRWVEEKPAYTVKSKKRELKECMGNKKVISNATVDCYYGQ